MVDVTCGMLFVADVSLTGHLSVDVAVDMVVFNLSLARTARGACRSVCYTFR